MTVYVVAGSTQEYERWLGKGGTRYEDEPVKLLLAAGQIRRMKGDDRLVLLQGWSSRSDWRDIHNTMLATGRRGDR